MSKIILVTGGARSGKSTFAEHIADKSSKDVAYIATAIVTDKDMENRIKHHQESRPQHWKTIEKYSKFNQLIEDSNVEVYLLDCVTVMVTNLMFDSKLDFDQATNKEISELEKIIKNEIETLLIWVKNHQRTIILVSNEVGLGLVPSYRLGSIFRDIAGRMNQYIASEADEVYFVVSGIPMQIKGGEKC